MCIPYSVIRYGNEVAPLAKDQTDPSPDGQNGLKEFREAGVSVRSNNPDNEGPGQSDEDHGNDD